MPNFLSLAQPGKNNWWRYLLTLGVILIANIIGTIPKLIADPESLTQSSTQVLISNSPFDLALNLLPFVFTFAGLLLAVRYIHGRSVLTVLSSASSLRIRHILWGFGLTLSLSVVIEIAGYFMDPANYTITFDAARTLPFALVIVFLIPLQAATEEVLFRGYMMQGLFLLSRRPITPMLISSVLFGLMHSANPEVTSVGIMIYLPIQILAGLVLSFIVVTDEGLETAIGIHTAMNIYSFIIISYPGSMLPLPAVFSYKVMDATFMACGELVLLICLLLIYRRQFAQLRWASFFKTVPLPPADNMFDGEPAIQN